MPGTFSDLWLFWLGAFVVIEAAAILRPQPGDTLSEHVWRWFRGWRRWLLAGFLAWLFVHLVFGV
jgi:hypothetical protein